MMQVNSVIPEQQERELHGFVIFLILLLLFPLSVMLKSMTHRGQEPEFQEIFRTL
jgi:hypothetical protein